MQCSLRATYISIFLLKILIWDRHFIGPNFQNVGEDIIIIFRFSNESVTLINETLSLQNKISILSR